MIRLAGLLFLSLLLPQDLDSKRDALAARLETLRGLKFKTPVKLREGTRREYAAYVLENARRVYGDLAAAEKGLKALGLIPPKLRLEVALTAQAGLGAKVFCAGDEVVLLDPLAGDEWILNKMDLGLIDQHYAAPADANTFDSQMAWAALRMGDAEVVKHLIWNSGRIGDETVKKVAEETLSWEKGASKLASSIAPRLFVRSADFSWRRGAVFALSQQVRGKLDAAYARPPVSTKQVIHPEKYAENVKPVRIEAEAARDFLAGHDYKPVYRTVLGELGVAMVLETHFPQEDVAAASEGWSGDDFAVFEKEGTPPLALWITEWDTEEDAVKFQAQAFRLMKRVEPPDSELAAPVLREKSLVIFAIHVPKDLQDGLLDAAGKCKRTRAKSY